MIGLLVIEIIVGYEWLMSGIVKIVRGDFPSGLAEELVKKSEGAATWYAAFLKAAVIPFATGFGYFIEISEVLAGIALIGGPLLWLFMWNRVPDLTRRAVCLIIALAAIGATLLAINLHLANAASHPWLFPADAFDEGIDLDSVLPAIQVVIATISIILFRRLGQSDASNDIETNS